MTDLEWRGVRRADRRAIQAFQSTAPAPRQPGGRVSSHPVPWGHHVDKLIHALKPPLGSDRHLSLGIDPGGEIAAVILVIDDQDSEFFHIGLIAVSLEHRRARVGDVVIEQALDTIAIRARARDLRSVIISANIDERNIPSRKCFVRNGFTLDRVVDGYGQWLLVLDI
jgi:predicted N-acetyltransferase YhbS